MEKQFNSDLEPTRLEETLTFTVGQYPSQGTPSLNQLYDDDRVTFYFVDLGTGELTLHLHLKVKASLSVIKHVGEVFNFIVLGCIERGMTYIDTWVEDDMKQIRFAEFYGFEETGFLRNIEYSDGRNILLREMRYAIPNLDEE